MSSSAVEKFGALSCLIKLLDVFGLRLEGLNPGHTILVNYNNLTDGPSAHWSLATFTVCCYDFNYEREIITMFGTLGTVSGPLDVSIVIDGRHGDRHAEDWSPTLTMNDGKQNDDGIANHFGYPAFVIPDRTEI